MKLANLLDAIIRLDPGADAMEYHGQWWRWQDVANLVDALNKTLTEFGFGAATRVGCLLRNTPEHAAAIFAQIIGGRCIVTLNPSLPDDRLADDIINVSTPVLIASAKDWQRDGLLAAAEKIGAVGVVLTGDRARPVGVITTGIIGHADPARRDAYGVAVEMLTSGTTGTPKRIALATTTIDKAIEDAGSYGGRGADDAPRLASGVQLLNAPFVHVGGLIGLLNNAASGRKMCILDRFEVNVWVDAVQRHRPKVASAPPAALRMILAADVPKDAMSSLVAMRTGTAPLDPDLADAFYLRFGIPVLQNYGATEFAGGVAGWTLADFKKRHKDKRGAVGCMNPGCEARIVDPETFVELPFGAKGLLELRGPHLGDGKSWLRTTDLALLDADNFLWIVGRADNAIIRGGFKVFPDEIVKVLQQHPSIREAAVVALSDERLGQVPAAAYILKSGAAAVDGNMLREFLRDRLLPYQVPTLFRQLDELPRTPSLKVSQPELKKIFLGSDVV